MSKNKPLRLAIVGGSRGAVHYNVTLAMPEKVEVVAICDQKQEVLSRWKKEFPTLKLFTSFEKILDEAGIDAVVLATPMHLHARQAIQAMHAGKHVLCEVAAADTVEACWELVETVEKTGMTYMMAENFCFLRTNMMVKNMVKHGAFGELTHAECGYIHDVRAATHLPDGTIAWRGQMLRDFDGINYPTHSMGPMAQWLNINRTDYFDYMVTISSKTASLPAYYAQKFGDEHPGAKREFWKQGDSTLSLVRTKNGVVIYLRNDFSSPRPWNYTFNALQGTKGAYESGREISESPVAWFSDGNLDTSIAHWKSLDDFAAEFEHPSWIKDGKVATKVSRNGEYFVMQEFAAAIAEKRAPAFDIYDAVAVSSIFPLSVQSVKEGGEPVKFPDFTKNKSMN